VCRHDCRSKDALNNIRKVAFPERLANSVISYVAYLGQTMWPARLAVLYPYREYSLNSPQVILALLLLLLISVGVWIYRKPYPFLLIGWLWFVGALVPMSGLVQVGWQPRADRYTYLPHIGLFVAMTCGMVELFKHRPTYRRLLAVAGLLMVLTLIVPARGQTSYWKSSVTLWQHAVASTTDNYIAYNNLGQALSAEGEVDQAVVAYERGIQINSSLPEAEYNLANVYVQKHDLAQAMVHYRRALQIRPAYAEAEFNLGTALLQSGDPREAISHYKRAVELKPDSAEMQAHLANLLLRTGEGQSRDQTLSEGPR
jgi:protein O-mannosyl-transferase